MLVLLCILDVGTCHPLILVSAEHCMGKLYSARVEIWQVQLDTEGQPSPVFVCKPPPPLVENRDPGGVTGRTIVASGDFFLALNRET